MRLAPTRLSAGTGNFLRAIGDVERLPLASHGFDLIVSLLALHHVNDLPGALIQIRSALGPDGLLLAALAGGDTLTELRQSLVVAESDLRAAPRRASPLSPTCARSAACCSAPASLCPWSISIASSCGITTSAALMRDLRAFGATNALSARRRTPLRRNVLERAAAVYAERFADPDGRLRATFEILWLSGWAPHESQPKPLKPGSAAMRLEDALKRTR